MPDTIAAWAGKLVEYLPAAAGAAVSLKFLPSGLSQLERFASMISAYLIGTYIGRGITGYLNIHEPRAVDAIVFGVALFGMTFVGTMISEIKPALQAARKRWIGEAPEDKGV